MLHHRHAPQRLLFDSRDWRSTEAYNCFFSVLQKAADDVLTVMSFF
jgi:hypothetical protein